MKMAVATTLAGWALLMICAMDPDLAAAPPAADGAAAPDASPQATQPAGNAQRRLRTGDMIFASVKDRSRAHIHVVFVHARRIDREGELPLARGGSIKAAGLTIDDLSKAVRAAYEKSFGLAAEADVQVRLEGPLPPQPAPSETEAAAMLGLTPPVDVKFCEIAKDGGTVLVRLSDSKGREYPFCLHRDHRNGPVFTGAIHPTHPQATRQPIGGEVERALAVLLQAWLDRQMDPATGLLSKPGREAERKARFVLVVIRSLAPRTGLADPAVRGPATQPAKPPGWTAWSPQVNGLRFRIRVLWESMEKGRRLPVEIEVCNVGKKDLYVADPGKMGNDDARLWFDPFILVDGQRRKLPTFLGESVVPPDWFVLLQPGKSIVGKRIILCQLPAGQHQLCFRVPPGWPLGVHSGDWSKEDLARIEPKAWRNDNGGAAMGPIPVQRQAGGSITPLPAAAKPAAAWSKAVKGLRWRCWIDRGKVESGNPVRVQMEFQNVSDRPLRMLKAASVATCLPTLYTSEGGKDLFLLLPLDQRAIAPAETVLLEPGKTHGLAWNAFPSWRKPTGPAKIVIHYSSPKNTNPKVTDFWSGGLEAVTLNFEIVPASDKTVQQRVDSARAGLEKIGALLEAYRGQHNEYPRYLQDALTDANRRLMSCPATGSTYGYSRQPKAGAPLVYSGEFTQAGRIKRIELDASGQVTIRDIRAAPPPPPPPAPRPSGADLDAQAMSELWVKMGAADPNAAREAAASLATGGENVVAFLARQLAGSANAAEAQEIEALIGKLAADQFKQREQATAQLDRTGAAAARLMKEALDGAELEARIRIAKLLKSHGRRAPWGIAVLAWIGSDRAREVVDELVKSDHELAAYARFARGLLANPASLRSIRKFGINRGSPLAGGFLFVNGQYIDTPYVVERWGLDVYINGRLFRRGIDPENVFGSSQAEHNKDYAERHLSGQAAWFISGGGKVTMSGRRAVEFLRAKLAAHDAAAPSAPGQADLPAAGRMQEEFQKLDHAIGRFRPTPQLYKRLGMKPPHDKMDPASPATQPAAGPQSE